LSRISTAVCTPINSAPGGGDRCHGPADQDYPRTARHRSFRERIAHLAAGAIGDVAHRVERLLRGTGGDQYGLTIQIVGTTALAFDRGGDRLGIRQPAGTDHPAGQISAIRLDDGV